MTLKPVVCPLGLPVLEILSHLSTLEMASPWDDKQGMGRLTFLPALIPGAPPPNLELPAEPQPGDFIQMFRAHARRAVDPELLVDREALWQNESIDVHGEKPNWLTLMPDQELKIYKEILIDELGCDFRSLQTFVSLVRKGERGYYEACRILAHLLKDKDLDPSRPQQNHSKWLKSACDEALEALENPESWEGGPAGNPRPSKGSDAWHEKGTSKGASSSSSSSTWQQGGKGSWKGWTPGFR